MSSSPYQAAAPSLRHRGYSVIPLVAKSKYPVIAHWSECCTRMPTDEEHARWMSWKASNVGLCLGPASGVMALDFDDDVDGMHAAIRAIIPESPVQKRGARGFTAFYRFSGEASAGLNAKGTRVLDVLSTGRQTVLPPSLHPAGGLYEWITPQTLADFPPDKLPTIPSASLATVHKLFRPEPETAHRPIRLNKDAYTETTDSDVIEALSYIPADDYDVWIRIGMALRQHLGEGGLGLWDRWSRGSAKYDAQSIAKKWRSFKRTDITISSVFYMAMDRGYVRSYKADSPLPRVTIEEGGNLRPARITPSVPSVDLFSPPGLVGRIAKWINSTAIYPQPVLAIGAAIACSGAVMAHKIQSPTRLRTNFYTLGLAPSGAGKDHARKCVVNLLKYSGLDGLLGGEPASSAGLLTALREGGGRCLVQWDEFGRVLRQLTHKNAASHQADILRGMVELFSCSGSIYAGVQYADHDGKMKRKPIDQPCLSIYGTTVPENFFSSITQSDAVDGFLARFLVMESRDYSLEGEANVADINDPPEELLAELRRWKDAPSNYNPKGNVDGVLNVCPMVVAYDAEAEALIREYSRTMRMRVVQESEKRSGLSSIYARLGEHAIKLALIAHEGDAIRADAMRWAIAFADWCGTYLTEAVTRNVASNEFERSSKKILGIIREGGSDWVQQSVLTRRTQEFNARQRSEILQNLAEAGLVEIDKRKVEGIDKPTTYYRISSQ